MKPRIWYTPQSKVWRCAYIKDTFKTSKGTVVRSLYFWFTGRGNTPSEAYSSLMKQVGANPMGLL